MTIDFSPLELRRFTEEDTEGVVEVLRVCYAGYGQVIELDTLDRDLLEIPQRYPEPRCTFQVLRDAKKVVGTVAVRGGDGAAAELKRVFLLPEYRGRGFGKNMVLWAAAWARKAGYETLVFWSDELFTTAHHLYRRLGCEETGERRPLGGRNDVMEIGFRWELETLDGGTEPKPP